MTNKKIRLSVPFSSAVYDRIREEAEMRGVSMSTYVAFVIGDHFARLDRTEKSLSDSLVNMTFDSMQNQNDSIPDVKTKK